MVAMCEQHHHRVVSWTTMSRMSSPTESPRESNVLPLPSAPDAIELRHLRSFVAVAEELNFGRAATRLYVSQPALSRQIRALERLVGCDLLRRSTHRVELTIAGEALLDRTRDLLHNLDDAVSATRSVGGELAGRAARMWDSVGAAVVGEDLEEARAAYEAIQEQFEPPAEIRIRSVTAGGVPSLLLGPRTGEAPTMMHLHGGGYVLGSAFGYRPLVGALAAAADAAVLLPDFRLAPEHPFPAALEDALNAYLWMLERGTPPESITLTGDSAGGGLVLSVLLSLREDDLPMPGGAILFSPGVDMSVRRYAEQADPKDLALVRHYADMYLAGHPVDDPLVSPLYADLHGLPKTLIQNCTADPIALDSKAIAERLRDHGVDVRLDLYPGDTHVFQVFWSFLPEASDAVRRAGEFAAAIRRA
jgi:monoterpene epsilon-lactone hydrolase